MEGGSQRFGGLGVSEAVMEIGDISKMVALFHIPYRLTTLSFVSFIY